MRQASGARRGWGRARWHGERINWSAYAFVLPFLVPFLLFTFVATAFGAVVAVTDWGIIGPPRWVGLKNFEQALSDPLLSQAFFNTLRYGLIIAPSVTILGFAAALFVNQRWPGYIFARVAFYAPYTVSATVIGLVWVWMLDTQFGIVNQYLGLRIPWLTSPDWALVGVSIASIWWELGLAFIIFLAALQGLDPEVQEAAKLDGPSRWQSTRYIILPLIRPALSLVITLEVIASLKIFSQIHVMTNGGPASASSSVIWYIYTYAIIRGKLGYASAIALMLFIIIIAITFLHRRLVRENV